MDNNSTYTTKIKNLISNQKKIPISEIKKLTYLKSIDFEQTTYKERIELIKENGLTAISEFNVDTIKSFEDITFFDVKNQVEEVYIVVIYDSDRLWQDPEIWDIFPIRG